MMMKAMIDATAWVAMVGQRGRQPAEAALDQPGERRLADPAEAQRGEGDAELGGGDVAVERLYRAAGQPSFAIPGPGHLVQPGAPSADQCELGRHEEGVREHQDDDRRPVRDLSRGNAADSIRFKCSTPKVLPRGPRMIRVLAVPPFEALDPLLPRRAGSDPETREAVRRILEDVLERGDEAVRGVYPPVRRRGPRRRGSGSSTRPPGRGR